MDTQRAQQLVSDDALEARGLRYGSTLLLAEHERAATDPAAVDYELAAYPAKGKGRSYRDDEDADDINNDDDDARTSGAWTREAGNNGAFSGRRASSASTGSSDLRRHSYSAAEAGQGRRWTSKRAAHAHQPLNHHHHGHEETPDERRLRLLWWRSAAINVLFILAWYCFSTLISLYNKWMFSADHYNFPYPLFVTSVHMLVQWCLSALTLSIFRSLRPKTRPQPRDYATKVAPCGMATGLDIGLSNLSLRTITLSFYTMCKSSSLAFVLMFAFLFRLEVPSWRLVGIILIITSGVVLMVSTETQFDFVGMCQVLTASALGGLRWSLTQLLLHKESMGMNNPIATLFWLAPIMGITLATCSLIFDGWGNVFAHDEFWGSLGATIQTVCAIVFPGVLAFMMNVTEFGLIQRTSVVTLSVAGIFKEVLTIFLSTVLFHDQLTPINVSGLCVTIFGIALYNYLKYRQFTHGNAHPKGIHHDHHDGSRSEEAGLGAGSRSEGDSAEDPDGEGAPMLPVAGQGSRGTHARHSSLAGAAAGSGGGHGGLAAPNHELGSDDDDDDDERGEAGEEEMDEPERERAGGQRPRRHPRTGSGSGSASGMSSYEDLDAQAARLLDDFDAEAAEAHSLMRLSERDKAQQRDADRIEGLEDKVAHAVPDEVDRERRELEHHFAEEEQRHKRDMLGDED